MIFNAYQLDDELKLVSEQNYERSYEQKEI